MTSVFDTIDYGPQEGDADWDHAMELRRRLDAVLAQASAV